MTVLVPTPSFLASLRLGEGLRLKAYRDTKGVITIAYGRANRCKPGDTCTLAQAESWLYDDAQKAIDVLIAKLPWSKTLDQVRFEVLAEMLYNMGWGARETHHGLASFTSTLVATQGHRWRDAAGGMLRSGWADDVGDRAIRLADRMLTGSY